MPTAGAMTAADSAARIGPNAVTRMAEALRALQGEAMAARIFAAAALGDMLRHPPEEMIDERDLARLHHSAHAALGAVGAAAVARDAGARTGAYLLAHRIPRPVQWILRRLPAPLAARVLVAAIARHAWTFAGSGEFGVRWQRGGVRLSIANCPLCREISAGDPACDFYCATFERLFGELVRDGSTASEVTCQACGGKACIFEVRW
jgi:divinyl protochlorophyllide a 8-vinyl-reductase